VDHRFDVRQQACICAADSCCPASHRYEAEIAACVCHGASCCPGGFAYDEQRARCLCADDRGCLPGFSCSREEGRCRCESDRACGEGWRCAADGTCHPPLRCTDNSVCAPGTFCDVARGQCVDERQGCLVDAHCPFGTVCQDGRCRPGCRTTADCPLGDSCQRGRCISGWCEDNQFCEYLQICDRSSGRCLPWVSDLCAPCSNGELCSSGLCLQAIVEGDERLFCGQLCEVDADCPGGFECSDVFFGCLGVGCPEELVCRAVPTVNEDTQQLCCDPLTGKPSAVARTCSPRDGRCR